MSTINTFNYFDFGIKPLSSLELSTIEGGNPLVIARRILQAVKAIEAIMSYDDFGGFHGEDGPGSRGSGASGTW